MEFCECLIDQDRYIGSDPVGYKCMNTAVWVIGGAGILIGKKFCDDCKKIREETPERITFPQGKV